MEVIDRASYDAQPEMSINTLTEQVRSAVLETHDLSVPEECTGFLVRCLRVKDYNVEKAAKLVKNVARSIEALRDMHDKFRPKLYKDLYLNGIFTVLSSRDDNGRQILVSRMGKWDPKAFEFDGTTCAFMILFGYVLGHSAETQRNGVVFVFDLTDFGMHHVKGMKPSRLTQLVRMMQDGAPGKIKGIHLVFHPRVHFHGDDLTSLHKFIRPDILPISLGGCTEELVGTDIPLLHKLIQEDSIHKDLKAYGIPTL